WLPAQEHSGENIGESDTHELFVELKNSGPRTTDTVSLGPD
ncbi:MAG: hypothetical protein JWR82_291, partial [Blastococcus sp.]|nr:hypothetical protein [Blastococcus sp.]